MPDKTATAWEINKDTTPNNYQYSTTANTAIWIHPVTVNVPTKKPVLSKCEQFIFIHTG